VVKILNLTKETILKVLLILAGIAVGAFGIILALGIRMLAKSGKKDIAQIFFGKNTKTPALITPKLAKAMLSAPPGSHFGTIAGPKAEEMTGYERIEAAMTFGKLDRVPVGPFLLHHVAKTTGLSISDFLFDFKKSRQAGRVAYDIYGQPDLVSWFPGSGYLLFGGERLLFGTDWVIKENAPVQIIEKKQWEVEDYDRFIEQGLSKTMLKSPPEGIYPFLRAARYIRQELHYWQRVRKAAGWVGSVTVFPFEILSWKRSFQEFMVDVHKVPDKIIAASDFMADGLVALAKLQGYFTGLKRVFFDCNRASATFISPRHFEKLVLPSLKRMVESLVADGFDILFHLDTDWVPMLPYFKQFPKGRYIVELEYTDIRKAKEILAGHMCVKGNVSSTLLSLGSADEVEREARNLIEDLAPGGGFILASGCEVPIDAPLENVKALIGAAKKYGHY
jgi:uroporphyrinogen-III decarboxylase